MKTHLLATMIAATLLAASGSWCPSAPVPVAETEPTEVVTLRHGASVSCLSFSSDSKMLVSGGYDDQKVKLWDVVARKQTATFDVAATQPAQLTSVIISHDGKSVAAVGLAAHLQVWDVASGEKTATVADSRSPSLAYSPDDKVLAYVGAGVWLYDVKAKEKREPFKDIFEQFKETRDRFTMVTFGPKGKLLLVTVDNYSNANSRTFALWDVEATKKTATFEAGKSGIYNIAISADGKILASVSQDDKVRLWDATTGKCTVTRDVHAAEGWLGKYKAVGLPLAFSPDGKLLAVHDFPEIGSPNGGSVLVFDVATGKELAHLNGYNDLIASFVFSPDGKLLATGTVDGKIKVWSIPSGWTAKK